MESKSNNILDNIKTMFQRKNSSRVEDCPSPKPIPLLSVLANTVVGRCSKILKTTTEELHSSFEAEMPEASKQPPTPYARNLLEFCSFKALNVMVARSDYLSDKEFRRLAFDMMLAWEAPGVDGDPIDKEMSSSNNQCAEDEDGWSLFYTNSTDMAVQVDNNKTTIGPEAFVRMAPACAVIADVITVQNLFDALTSSSGDRLHFLIFEKYLQSLDKVMKSTKNAVSTSSNLQLVEDEIVLDLDGSVPTKPVLQHIGISAWPGRLTLTNHALYFESLGMGLYEKAVRYDLSTELKQVIKPELTGPLGARLFDKAVMYRSISVNEPVYLEFPEFKGSMRRDYWLDVCLEILRVHKFVRQYNLKGIQQSEAIARAILGIFRCRAVKEAFHAFSSNYKTLLVFNLAESLPGGDVILESLSSRLPLSGGSAEENSTGTPKSKGQRVLSPVSLLTLSRLGLAVQKVADIDGEGMHPSGYICVGEVDSLEMAVKQSKIYTGKAEAAQATVDQVKVDGIDTNLAVMKELLYPVISLSNYVQHLSTWEEPLKSALFLVITCYMIGSGWFRLILPSVLVFLAIIMLWHRYFNKGKPVKAFKITPPPNRNAVEQLITLQEAIAQVESLVQAGNIILLKTRALLLAVFPQATEMVALFLVFTAAMFAFMPLRYIILLVFVEAYTREMPLRRDSSYRWVRRVREWWIRIPAAPVQLIKPEESKKKK